MAINLDRNLLQELGLAALPENEKTSLLNQIYETLEMRVGVRLADHMSNEQLDEFEKYFEAKDDAGAFHWLETNFPNYKDIVQEEFNKLKEEVRQSAPQILQVSAQQASAAPSHSGQPLNNAPANLPLTAQAPAQPQSQPQPPYVAPAQPPVSPYGQTIQPQSPPLNYTSPQPSQSPPSTSPNVYPQAAPNYTPPAAPQPPQPPYYPPAPTP